MRNKIKLLVMVLLVGARAVLALAETAQKKQEAVTRVSRTEHISIALKIGFGLQTPCRDASRISISAGLETPI